MFFTILQLSLTADVVYCNTTKFDFVYFQEQGTIKNKQLLVCVKPMVHNYTDSYQLKEFIEMNRILGAHKVALYLYEVSPKLKPLLGGYQSQKRDNINLFE